MALDTGPDAAALLTTALEKLLYLESRLESAEAAREHALREGDRHRVAAGHARRLLTDWQRRATESEVAAEGAEREVKLLREALGDAKEALAASPREAELAARLEDAEGRLARLTREREAWLDRMVSLSRLRGGDGDELDLGSFIAELRAELMALRSGEGANRAPATVSDRPGKVDARALLGEEPTPRPDPEQLVRAAKLSRAERTLALLCARDLESDSPAVRRRAAERLTEAGLGVLNPIAVQLVHRESSPHVRAALVRLLDRTAPEDTATLALGSALEDADPRVRATALEGLSRRRSDVSRAALRDTSASVRRRALASLGRDGAALDALADALRDEDASVRRVAALALSGRAGPEAEALLRVAAHAEDAAVRELARATLERRGLSFDAPPAPLPEVTPPLEAAPAVTAAPIEQPTAPVAAAEPGPVELEADAAPIAPQAAPEARAETDATADEPAVEAPASDPVDDAILDEIRMSLRGRTPEELALHLALEDHAISRAVARLTGSGRLIWRGRKLYLP